jgi:hypothetical protein
MFSYLTGQQFLLITAGSIALYYGVVALYYRRRTEEPAFSTNNPSLPANHTLIVGTAQELIGAPAPEWEEELELFLEPDREGNYGIEMLEDDDSILLKEAESVVEEIQEVVTHIATYPPNPEEVFTKIRAIVRQYRIFQNTEYFEAINAFIAQAVERECDIRCTSDDLLVLWK